MKKIEQLKTLKIIRGIVGADNLQNIPFVKKVLRQKFLQNIEHLNSFLEPDEQQY